MYQHASCYHVVLRHSVSGFNPYLKRTKQVLQFELNKRVMTEEYKNISCIIRESNLSRVAWAIRMSLEGSFCCFKQVIMHRYCITKHKTPPTIQACLGFYSSAFDMFLYIIWSVINMKLTQCQSVLVMPVVKLFFIYFQKWNEIRSAHANKS